MNEGNNELIFIHSGGGFNTSDIQIDFDNNNNFAGPQNNDINTDNGNWPADPTPCELTTGNLGQMNGCPNLIAVGPGVDIPANAIVVVQTGSGSDPGLYNMTSLCGAGQCVYVIASTCNRTGGAFSNTGTGTRTTNFSVSGACLQSVTYNLATIPNVDGAYYLPLTNMYGTNGCAPPPTSPAPPVPVINPHPNITLCGDYTLPPITGTNLTGNEAYYTGPNGTGTQYNAGDVINTPGTYYIFDQNGPVGCFDQEQFTVTLGATPVVNQPNDVTVCAGLNVNVAFTGTPGATFSWTNDNTAIGLGASGTGNLNFPGANVTNQEIATITVTPTLAGCTGDPVTFTITVNPRPQVDDPPNQTVCGGEQVDVMFTGSGANPTYNWTNNNTGIGLPASGSGDISFTANNPSAPLTGTITVTATENGCAGTPQTFTITVNPAPSMNQPADIVRCAGQNVTVNFSGSAGAVFNWTNDNTAIGLGAGGTGNLNFPAANVGSQETATITVTPSNAAGTCNGTPVTFTITINPGPTVDNPGDQQLCGGQFVSIPLNSPTNPTLNWTNSNTAIGLPATGSGDINFNTANVAVPQTATITVTPTENGCTGIPQVFTITVNPSPFVNQPNNVVVCSGVNVSVDFTGTPNATFNWTNDNPAIGLDPSGSGNILFSTADLVFQEVATITVTPNNGFCDGLPRTFTITVNPTPIMDVPPNLTVCGLQPVNVVFNSPGSPTFNWTNSNTGIGLPAGGSGNLSFTAANVTNNQTGNIVVTPTEAGCPGNPVNFSITAVPAPMVNQPGNVTICAGQSILINFSGSPGAIFNWTNNNPAIGLPASGTGNLNLTGAAVATQQTGTITVTPSNGSCNGASVTFTITVNPTPTVTQPANVSVCNGDPVAVNFSGTPGATFNWTNNNPAIGLGATGSGNIGFNAATVTAPETATILVTPVSGACTGTPVAFTITVSPGVSVNNPGNRSACVGDQVTVNFTGAGNPTFNWTNNNTAIGLGASGSGNISFPAANVATTQTATITVTPVGAGCPGMPQTFTITVGPAPALTPPADLTVCGNQPVNVPFNVPAGTTVNWSNSNPAIGLAANGSGNLNFTAAGVATPQTATITALPILGSCNGALVSFTITVNPGVSVDSVGDQSVCAGDSVSIPFSDTGNPTISWTNDNTAIGLPASGTGDINFVAANVTAPETATITVTPQLLIGGYAYITNSGSNNVSVIDIATNTVIATIPVGNSPWGVSTNTDGSRIYVSNQGESSISVIDVATNTVIATVPVGASPTGITVSPDNSRIYVTNNSTISVIDAASNTVIATINVAGGTYGIVTSPDGSKVYVTNPATAVNTVAVIDAASNTILSTIPVGDTPYGIVVSPDGSKLYVSNNGANSVSVIDVATGSVTNTIPVGTSPQGIAISPDGSLVYVANEVSGTVSVINTATNTVVASVPAGGPGPIGLSVTPDGGLVYIANLLTNNVSVMDAATNTLVANIAVGANPAAFGKFITPVSSCPGAPRTFTITVNPLPTLTAPNNATACGLQTVNIPFTPSAGATVNWTNSNPAIGLPASGSGNLFFTAANVAAPQTATITATPVLGGCAGAPVSFTITINPRAAGSIAGDLLLCAGDSTVLTASGGGGYEWDGGETTASITVTPLAPTNYTVIITNIFNCATAASVLVDVDESPAAAIAGNTTLCEGQSTTLTASGNGNYSWSTAAVTPDITVAPAVTTTYTVTVTNAFNCSATSSATVVVNPADTLNISGVSCNPADTGTTVLVLQNQFGCDSVIISGITLAPSNAVSLTASTCNPNNAGTFIQNLTNQFGCDSIVTTVVTFDPSAIDTTQLSATTCDPALAGTTQVLLPGSDGCDSIVITVTTLLPTDTVNLTATTCDPAQAGTFTQTLPNQFGCDSTVVTTVTLSPADTVNLTATTCDPAQAGTFTQSFTNQFGCDSTIITTVTLSPADTVNLTATTCNPNGAGTFTQSFTNQFGCDSTVITTVSFDPAAVDTTLLNATTCDPAQAGMTEMLLSGADGCDSLVITTTVLIPADTVNLAATTCNPAQAGIFTQTLPNQFGCDSIIITTVTLSPTDTVNLTATTCDPAQAGTFTQTLPNQFGCDSTVITTVTLLPSDTVNLTATTCDPAQAGTFTQTLPNQFGCDSTVMTTVTLLPSDTVYQTVFTCDSASAGVITQTFPNQSGCDSTVITTSIFDPTLIDITILDSTTCDPTLAGTTQILLQGSDGCDSLVVLTLALLPSDTIIVTSFTCDPAAAGIFTQVLPNQFGCDSVLISEVIFDPFPCAPAVALSSTNATCAGSADGSISLQIQNGQPPLQYAWAGPGGSSGNGQITDVSVPLVLNNLPAGAYTVTVTDPLNGASTTATATIGQPPALTATAAAQAVFSGFAVRCADSADGTINGTATGGTPPYQFAWNNGDTGPALDSARAGSYTLIVTDANGCTGQASATLTAPPALSFALDVARPDCGDSLVDATIMAAGGVLPYTISVDGNVIAGTMPALGSGTHVVALSDANGCSVDSSLTLNLPPVPQLFLPSDTTVVLGHPVRIEAGTNLTNWVSLVWQPLPDSSCADCLVQEWTPAQSQQITVTIQDSFGCTARAVVRVLVERITELYVPNVFSPNGDGINDIWQVNAGLSVTEIEAVRVFDRWGNLQYEWLNPVEPNLWPGWDGATRGKKAELGVYVYYMKVKLADGTTTLIEGDVTVMER